MDSTITAALIGALIALVAAIISAIVTIRGWQEEQRRLFQQQKYQVQVDHIRRQIEELYGPLYGLIQQSEAIGHVYERILPLANQKKDSHDESTEFANVWIFFRENYFYPIRAKQAELILSKVHLLHSQTIPESFYAFLRHNATGECLLRLWKEHGIDSMKKGVMSHYPEEQFHDDVKNSLDDLMKTYKILMQRQTDV